LSSGSIDHGRFAPGAVLADRYRIIGRLGKGGMGEVYRADDLRLGQQVALKFLPGTLERDPVKLAQFHAEVRLARQVAHPNVCRVYDIDEADGAPFLSMEYVDGEDLASLLRRIGRLPQDKGLDVSRQLCAGLAAAHARGVLHRDLKPANVMLDGEGTVRLTDFGLAAIAGAADSNRAGTPAYMAPEQLAGREVTVQSDLFALGLVLYEIFTGRRAFDVASIGELVGRHESMQLTRPGELVPDLDPLIERAILRCLQHDPANRPASALTVSAMLPGGDPLTAALAAGETPSPQVVAAAGHAVGLGVRAAVLSGIGALGLIAAAAWLSAAYGLMDGIPVVKAPDVLADRAQEMLQTFGHSEMNAASAHGFFVDDDYLQYLRTAAGAAQRAHAHDTRPSGLTFYYRTSPRALIPIGQTSDLTWWNPPVDVTGMTVVALDPQGRLRWFEAVPHEVEPQGPASPPSWSPLFRAAGLDESRLTAATPSRTPRSFADVRAAWAGELPDRPGVPIRVEAAAFRGRPVSFTILGPWSRPTRDQERQKMAGEMAVSLMVTVTVFLLIAASAVVARRHYRSGRSDRVGARRLAAAMGTTTIAGWVLAGTHVPDAAQELNRFFAEVGEALLVGALAWTLYVALEPYGRRLWPESLKGWTRLLSGHVRDARVGRDILIGAAVGAAAHLVAMLADPLSAMVTQQAPVVSGADTDFLVSSRHVVGGLLSVVFSSVFNAMWCIFLVVGLKVLLRRMWLAIAATLAFYLLLSVPAAVWSSTAPIVTAVTVVISVVLMIGSVIQFGLLVGAAAFLFKFVLSATPWSVMFTDWRSGPSLLVFAVLTAIVCSAAWAAAGPAAERTVRYHPL
jgi:serine/threonine-protein kinase